MYDDDMCPNVSGFGGRKSRVDEFFRMLEEDTSGGYRSDPEGYSKRANDFSLKALTDTAMNQLHESTLVSASVESTMYSTNS